MRLSPGYTFVELLVVVGIIVFLSVSSYVAFYSINSHKSLDGTAELIRGELDTARALTLDSKNDDQWGVHFATTSVTLFEGSSYNAATSSNVTSTFDPSVAISSTSLAGGGSDVVFTRLTGATTKNGTVIVSLTSSSSQSHTITIYQTGLAEVQ